MRRPVVALLLAIAMAALHVRAVSALEMRVAIVGVSASRVTVSFELRDLLRDKFVKIVDEGRWIFLQLQAELWEDRRIGDRMTLTTPALTFRVAKDGASGLMITSQYGNRSPQPGRQAPLPLRVDLGPSSVLADDRSYYLHAQITAASVAEQDIDQFGTAIFGDDQSAAGLAGIGRFVFSTLLRFGRYLESATAQATSSRYTGLEIKSRST